MVHEENAGKTAQKRVINNEIQGLEGERQTMLTVRDYTAVF